VAENLRFDEGSHRYYRGSIEIPSCTRCLDHAGLVSYDGVRQDILEKKSRLGTAVHMATHFYDENNLDWESVGDDAKPYVDGWAEFRETTGFVPMRIEERCEANLNGMPYGMQFDCLGMLGKQETIVEKKISSQALWWWAIQTAGYALGAPDLSRESSPMLRFSRRRRIAVQLLPVGKFKFKKYDFNDRQDADVFAATLLITHRKMREGAKIKDLDTP
jgi:hypothetical protein